MTEPAPDPTVSVIVPVRSDVEGVREVLACLRGQTYPASRFDVIVGGDGAPGGALADLETADGRVRVAPGPPETSYAARNRAAALSRSDVLAFLDSDCRPDPGWLRAGLAALDRADLVAGEVRLVAPARTTTWTLLTVDGFLDQSRNARRARAVTANLLVRRRDFERWGRFDATLASGGDFDFVERAVSAGARLTYAADAVVRHPTIDEGWPFLRKVWRTNWWSAFRRRRSGRTLSAASLVGCVPIVGAMVVRRETLRPIARLDDVRVRTTDICPGTLQEARAVLTYYVIVSQVANAARLAGWLTARGRAKGT